MKLTDLGIRSLQPPEKGAQIYYDDSLAGFGVRVSEGGTKSFILTHGARRTRETIGRVGILTLSDARQEAKRRLAEYTLGKTAPRAVSWATARDEYLDGVKQKRKPRTHEDYPRQERRAGSALRSLLRQHRAEHPRPRGPRLMRVVVLDGKAYYMKEIMKAYKEQQAARVKATQPPLFELKDDCRPKSQTTAAGRLTEPTFFGD